MDALPTIFAAGQALGAFCGALSVIWSELAYMRAKRDGSIDLAERAHLRAIAMGLRIGMFAFLISTIGLVVVAYMNRAALQPALTAGYWTFMVLALLIIGVSWALARRHISFALGTALVFTAWWLLAYLSLGWLPPLSFGGAAAFFVVAATIFYALLTSARALALRKA